MKEKQIKEMANDLRALDCVPYIPNATYHYRRAAKLRSLGYVRASDIAEEIFAEIEREFCGAYTYKGYTIERYIAKLKKKYTEGMNELVR